MKKRRKLRFKYIPLRKIDISQSNVRRANIDEDIDELAASIAEIGIQQPVVVFEKNSRFELIIGQRRYLASKEARLREIPAVITTIKNQTEAIIKSFSENIHRLKLDYRDKMNVATDLLNKLGSVQAVADALGLKEQTIRQYLGYAGVPEEIKVLVSKRKISAQTATNIARNITDEKKAVAIAKKVVETPRGDPRRAIIAIAKEYPRESVQKIERLAKKQKFRRITVHLTPKVSGALEVACQDFSSEPEDIAKNALEEWLADQGFLT